MVNKVFSLLYSFLVFLFMVNFYLTFVKLRQNYAVGKTSCGPRCNISASHPVKNKLILGWETLYVPEGESVFKTLNCKVQNCNVTYDHSFLNVSDAIIVRIPKGFTPPQKSSVNQRWVFLSHESPLHPRIQHLYGNPSFRNFFNWTMTYRLDSDIYFPFGGDVAHIHGRYNTSNRDLLTVLKSKPKLVSWIVSDCNANSKRDEYVKELQKHISVDIYGACGPLKTPYPFSRAQDLDRGNLLMINDTYLFYLAFENSLCKDYISEKLFKMLPYDVIPVVRGAANYSKVVPYKWYIDARDFHSPQELAEYLLHLHQNPDQMLQYFLNKENYGFNMVRWRESMAFCTLCEKLNNESEPLKVYDDVAGWFSKEDCEPVTDI